MGPLILGVLVLLVIGFLVFAYSRGGEQPTQRVEKQIDLPGASASGGDPAMTPEG